MAIVQERRLFRSCDQFSTTLASPLQPTQHPRDSVFNRRPLASAVLAASFFSVLPGLPVQAAEANAAQAQSQRFSFNIPAQALADALDAFSA
ncbi:hypothetical protein [Pseudomonas kurunegalensis]|uniref:hypothetical protein n=1 Tax=Pseudomonas kurunegalensis TaxID=485880 RepID=UPI0023648AAE|nr:hypothetical protein [Pseudomonas kurunegalensis]MDD2136733.1 hypothetical protein [Pseudomonas kurunegalensis]